MKIATIYTAGGGKLAQYMGGIYADVLGECELVEIVDPTLIADLVAEGHITEALNQRAMTCFERAAQENPDLILCACSSIGSQAEEANGKYPMPVLRIDQAMAEKAVTLGKRIAVVASFETTLGPTSDLILRCGEKAKVELEITPVVLKDYMPLVKSGQAAEALDLLKGKITELGGNHDVIVLAQASFGGQLDQVQPLVSIPVLASPILCAEQIKTTWWKGEQ